MPGLGLGQQIGGYREERVGRIGIEWHQVAARVNGQKIPFVLTYCNPEFTRLICSARDRFGIG